MDVDEAERDGRRRDQRIKLTGDRAVLERDHAFDQGGKVLGSSAEMVGERLLGGPLVHPDKAALGAQPKTHEPRIDQDNLLEALKLRKRQSDRSCLANGLPPPSHPLRRGGALPRW